MICHVTREYTERQRVSTRGWYDLCDPPSAVYASPLKVCMHYLIVDGVQQIEEEDNARRAIELFDVIGEDGTGLYEIDKAISKIGHDE